MKLIQAPCKPGARLMQGKHKSMLLLKAEGAGQHRDVGLGSCWDQPPSFIPYHKRRQINLSTGDTRHGRQRCFATHRMICPLFKSVAWISFATASRGQRSLQSYFMGLAKSQGCDTKGGWECVVTAGDVIQNPLNKTSFIHQAQHSPFQTPATRCHLESSE